MNLKLSNITPGPFRCLDEKWHTYAIVKDGVQVGCILWYPGTAWGDHRDCWKAFIQTPDAFQRGAPRHMPVKATFYGASRDGLLPEIRAFLENENDRTDAGIRPMGEASGG